MEGPLSSPRSPRSTHPGRCVPFQNSMKTQSLCHVNNHCQNLTHSSNATPSSEALLSPLWAPRDPHSLSSYRSTHGELSPCFNSHWDCVCLLLSPFKYLHTGSFGGSYICKYNLYFQRINPTVSTSATTNVPFAM